MSRTVLTRWATLSLIGAFLVTGCSGPGPDGLSEATVSAQELSLGDAVAAFSVSRQSAGFRGSGDNGYVALVDEHGTVRSFRTAGMDNAQIDWSAHGLVLSDVNTDYHLSDRLRSTQSPKTSFQQAMFAAGEHGSVAVYNDGFTDDGYVDQIVSAGEKVSTMNEVEGNYQVTGICDGVVHGLAEPSGPYAKQATAKGLSLMGEYELRSHMLNRLTTQDKEQLVALRDIPESGQYATDAPCHDGTLHHLATAYVPDGETSLVLRAWDVNTGTMKQHDISYARGTDPVIATERGFEVNGYTHHSRRDRHLDWVSTDRRVMSTDVGTGKTRELFRLQDPDIPEHADPGSVHFTRDTLTTLTEHPDTGAGVLITWDRDTGEQQRRIELPGLADAVKDGFVLRDVAVRPE